MKNGYSSVILAKPGAVITFKTADGSALTDYTITAGATIGEPVTIDDTAKTVTVNAEGVGQSVSIYLQKGDDYMTSTNYSLRICDDAQYDTLQQLYAGIDTDGIVPASTFAAAKENNVNLEVRAGAATWNFSSYRIPDGQPDFNAKVDVTQKAGFDAAFVTFSETGTVMDGTRLILDIGTDRYGNGLSNLLYLFKYDESTDMATKVLPLTYMYGKVDLEFSSYDLPTNLLETGSKYVIFAVIPNDTETYDKMNNGEAIPVPKEKATENPTQPETPSQNANGDVTVDISTDAKVEVPAGYFENAKANQTKVTVTVGSQISWTFKGKNIGDSSIAFNPHVSVSNKKFEGIKNDTITSGVFVDFVHNGNLPGKAKVSLNIGTEKFGNTDKTLHLYYYNPETNGYEYISAVAYNKGTVTMDLYHCSTYALVENRFDAPAPAAVGGAAAPAPAGATLDNEPKAGEISLMPIAMLSMISLAVAVVVKKK